MRFVVNAPASSSSSPSGAAAEELGTLARDLLTKRHVSKATRERAQAYLDTIDREVQSPTGTSPSAEVIDFHERFVAAVENGTHPAVKALLAGIESAELREEVRWMPTS